MNLNSLFSSLDFLILPITFILCAIFGIFLFWRAGRRELHDAEILFDVTFIFISGSVFFGRVADFLNRADFYGFSVKKLVFFNAYGGFNFWGALLGGVVAVYIFLRKRRQRIWDFLDLAVAPVLVSSSLFLIIKYLVSPILEKERDLTLLLLSAFYFILFFIVKRLEKRKRHIGFFTCFFIVLIAAFNLILSYFRPFYVYDFYKFRLDMVFFLVVLVVCGLIWYALSKRKIKDDVKNLSASFLLALFKALRVLTNVREADNTAKAIIFLPLVAFKVVANLVKLIGREISGAFLDFAAALGFRR